MNLSQELKTENVHVMATRTFLNLIYCKFSN